MMFVSINIPDTMGEWENEATALLCCAGIAFSYNRVCRAHRAFFTIRLSSTVAAAVPGMCVLHRST